jgi:carbamoyl-phosphate synthase large subunit
MKANLLVFGGGPLQLSIIETAIKLGYFTIVIDPDNNAPGKEIADIFYTVAGDDFDRTLEIAKQHNIKGIVTAATDKPILMMCRIAEQLNMPFPSYESCETVLDKAKFKKFLFENKLPHAKGISVVGDILPETLDLQFPLITKPVTNSGSRGVIKVENQNELSTAVHETLQHSKDSRFLIEEYIEGDEISVEVLVQKGIAHIIQITDKLVTPPPYNVEIGHIQPSKYSHLKENIRVLLQTVVDKSGLDNCALHPELKIKDDKITIIEIGPRLGGDFITSHLVPLSTGLNMEEQNIRLATSLPIETNTIERASTVSFLNFPVNSVIKNTINIEQLQELFPEVVSFSCSLRKGEKVKRITNSLDRYGSYILKGFDYNELFKARNNLNEFLNSLVN